MIRNTKNITISLQPTVIEKLKTLAKENNYTVSGYIAELVREKDLERQLKLNNDK